MLENSFILLISCAGFTTITSTALLFGKTTLHMSASSLIVVGILTPSSGILGSLVWPILQRRVGWSNLRILVMLVIMASLIPVYGCLGFLFQGRVRFGGLTTPGEMFGLAVYFGLSSSFCAAKLKLLNNAQVLCMELSKATHEHFTPSCCPQAKKQGGTGFSQLRTRFVHHTTYIYSVVLKTFRLSTVKFFYRPVGGWRHLRRLGQHSLFLLLSRLHDLARSADSHERRCRKREERCPGI